MTQQFKVSAIMPTYNSGPFIGSAIESIIDQSFSNWELIVVDDGSTDSTNEVLRRISDPRIRIVRLSHNHGRGYARNIAVTEATGNVIAVCDSDDVSLPERFARQVAFLTEHPSIDVVATQVLYFREGREPRVRFLAPQKPEEIQRRFDRGQMAVPNQSAMIRRSCFDRFGLYAEECRRAQDMEFFLRIRNECEFYTLPDFLVLYRHEDGIAYWKWAQIKHYERYARYRANAVSLGEGNLMPFRTFARRPSVPLAVHTVDALRFAKYRVFELMSKSAVLR